MLILVSDVPLDLIPFSYELWRQGKIVKSQAEPCSGLRYLRWGITWNLSIPAPTLVPLKWNRHQKEHLINIMWIEALLCCSCGFHFPKKDMRMGSSCCGRLLDKISNQMYVVLFFLLDKLIFTLLLPECHSAAWPTPSWPERPGVRSRCSPAEAGRDTLPPRWSPYRWTAGGSTGQSNLRTQVNSLNYCFVFFFHLLELIRQSVKLSFCIVMQTGGFIELTVSHVFIALTQASTPLTSLLKRALRLDPDHLLRHSCDGHPSRRGEDTWQIHDEKIVVLLQYTIYIFFPSNKGAFTFYCTFAVNNL